MYQQGLILMFKNIIISLIAGLISAILFVSIHNYYYRAPSIGAVKVDSIIKNHLSQYSAQELSEEETERITKLFGAAVTDVIRITSKEYNVILFVDPAVVTDIPDYTEIIQEEIDKRVK